MKFLKQVRVTALFLGESRLSHLIRLFLLRQEELQLYVHFLDRLDIALRVLLELDGRANVAIENQLIGEGEQLDKTHFTLHKVGATLGELIVLYRLEFIRYLVSGLENRSEEVIGGAELGLAS